MNLYLVLTLALAFLALVGLFRSRAAIAQSTLVAPWVWMLTSVGVVAGSELVIGVATDATTPIWSEALRYSAAMLTFAPGMAVLGAKRPQNSGWQWVVLTLWLVLVLPAVQTVVYGMGPRVSPYLAWRLLAAVLLLLEALNYVVSRYRWAALLWIAAQGVLLWPHSMADATTGPFYATIALAMMSIGVGLVAFSRSAPRDSLDHCTRLWTRFVDEFGSLWTFRVMGLVNQTADAADWPVRVMPFGFVSTASSATVAVCDQSPNVQKEVRVALRNTLRRFYSDDVLAGLEAARRDGGAM